MARIENPHVPNTSAYESRAFLECGTDADAPQVRADQLEYARTSSTSGDPAATARASGVNTRRHPPRADNGSDVSATDAITSPPIRDSSRASRRGVAQWENGTRRYRALMRQRVRVHCSVISV